ncbi:hypothetical protein AVEN_212208-1 [Araneus ventricosus]|uniref:Uncharacterized protein n=1 Tax=Araneus ventricosus TaxID=182803 RepID=A0A4Y2HTD0_ARAVE|nr:hypothetical protein AVEN_212208-1 [Araneus ventricosus]
MLVRGQTMEKKLGEGWMISQTVPWLPAPPFQRVVEERGFAVAGELRNTRDVAASDVREKSGWGAGNKEWCLGNATSSSSGASGCPVVVTSC